MANDVELRPWLIANKAIITHFRPRRWCDAELLYAYNRREYIPFIDGQPRIEDTPENLERNVMNHDTIFQLVCDITRKECKYSTRDGQQKKQIADLITTLRNARISLKILSMPSGDSGTSNDDILKIMDDSFEAAIVAAEKEE